MKSEAGDDEGAETDRERGKIVRPSIREAAPSFKPMAEVYPGVVIG